MDPAWKLLTDHARARHGTITWPDARRLGIERSLDDWCRGDRLRRPAPQVYVVAGAPASWHQRVAVAAGSTDGWASHRTAAALHALDGFPPRTVEVLRPHGRRRKRGDWVVHETRRLAGVDLDEVAGIPCTSLVRTVLDLPAVAPAALVARALDDACRRRPDLLAAVAQRHLELACRGRPGTRLLHVLIDERLGRNGFVASGFEACAVRLVQSVGLPEPVLQHAVRDGRFVCFLDLAWPPLRLGLECNSLAFHTGKRAHEWDHQRRRRLQRLGWELIEVTYDDVVRRGERTGREIRDLYRRREATLHSGVPHTAVAG